MEERIKCCTFNKMVDCNEKKCASCGWNPDVAERRIEGRQNKN